MNGFIGKLLCRLLTVEDCRRVANNFDSAKFIDYLCVNEIRYRSNNNFKDPPQPIDTQPTLSLSRQLSVLAVFLALSSWHQE